MTGEVRGLIAAAGESTRMGGFPKPLLHANGERFVERILATSRAAALGRPVVVLGYEARAVRERADLADAEVVVNADYERGMLSSVHAGIRAMEDDRPDALLLWPIDCPFAPPDVVEAIVDGFRESGADVVVPASGGRRGHPALFSAGVFDDLLSAPMDEGARAVVRAEGTDLVEIETTDDAVLVDVDTPSDYWAAVKRYA